MPYSFKMMYHYIYKLSCDYYEISQYNILLNYEVNAEETQF